jgi:hypothetical protein
MPDSSFFEVLQRGNPDPFAQEKLDRALVAGLILEVVLETPESSGRRSRVKRQVQHALLSHLAGKVTLQRFRDLARELDRWFPYYYPLLTMPEKTIQSNPPLPSPTPAPNQDFLTRWLGQKSYLLPRRRRRKLHQTGLLEFLRLREGAPFRVKDFQEFFGIDRKTAWEYLQKLHQAGLLAHNGRKSAAVRYSLEQQFLK